MKPGYQEGMQREVARGIIARPSGRGVVLEIPCTAGHVVEHHLDKMLPPDAMPRQLAQRGWLIARRKATCPEHVQKEKTPMATTSPAPAPETPAASDAARRATRMIFMALEDYYDEGKKAFKPGHSDKTIADELGVSEVYVAKVRDEHFGPLAEPEAITEIRRDLANASDAAKRLRTDADAVATGIEKTVAEISSRLDRVCKANGWRVA